MRVASRLDLEEGRLWPLDCSSVTDATTVQATPAGYTTDCNGSSAAIVHGCRPHPARYQSSRVLGEEIAKCDALLAVIGPSMRVMITAIGAWETPTSFVRIEIGIALKRPSTSFRFYWRARRFRMPINSWMTSKNWLCAPGSMSGIPRSTRTWNGLFVERVRRPTSRPPDPRETCPDSVDSGASSQ
jgi:hypothetical protein